MDFKHAALIVVDMQNDFLHPDGFTRRHAQDIGMPQGAFDLLRSPIPYIQKLTEFFHTHEKPVIYIYTAWAHDYSDVAIPLKAMREKAMKEGCLFTGSWGAGIIEELAPREGSHMVMKKAYGGFFQTSLDLTLRNLGVKTLFMTGVATNFCVETTAREAVGYGYDIVMISDATGTYEKEGHAATLRVITMGFGEVMSTEEVLKMGSSNS